MKRMRNTQQTVEANEELYRALVETTETGFVILDGEGRVLAANAEYIRLSGHRELEQILHRSVIEWTADADKERNGAAIRACLADGHVRNLEIHYSDARGRTTPVEIDATAVRTEGTVRILTLCRDISSRCVAEAERELSASLTRATFESTTDGLLVVDMEGRIEDYNTRFAQLWSIPQSILTERKDRRAIDFVLEQLSDPEAFAAKVREVYAEPEAESFDVLEFKDGRVFERYSRPQRMAGRTVGRVWSFRDVTDRRRAERELVAERDLLHALMDNSPDKVYFKDTQSRFIRISKSHALTLGLAEPSDAVGKSDFDFKSDAFARQTFAEEQQILRTGQPVVAKVEQHIRPDGRTQWTSVSKAPIKTEDGRITGIVGISRNITREMELQEQIQQASKIDAIGRLAGGVAHDFNNNLQAILGFTEMLLAYEATPEKRRQDLKEIQRAAERAADLTRQLLAFGRKQAISPRTLDLNEVAQGMEDLLRRLLGEDIRLELRLDPGLRHVRGDAGQIEQIIMNLSLNARDAMLNGGRLTLATANVAFEAQDTVSLSQSRPGHFACLAISDTGVGMNPDVQSHLFEPFFTTKPHGRGTGLGLAVVYGIVKQHNGWIHVYSQEGEGATFKVYLPVHGREAKPETPVDAGAAAPADASGRGERILIVEDEPGVRNLSSQVLSSAGYQVAACDSAEEALTLFEREQGRFDLLFSDIVLPNRNGIELANLIRGKSPSLPVLLCSGYNDERSRWSSILEREFRFIEKPYPIAALLQTVRDILDGVAASSPP